MFSRLLATAAILALPLLQPEDPRAKLVSDFDRDVKPFIAQYCNRCHGVLNPKGDLNLARFFTGQMALEKMDVWKDAAARVTALEMPPKKEQKQPSPDERAKLAAWVAGFKKLYVPDPGRGGFRRLSQTEYANTLADLLGVDPKIADEVPKDEAGPGFASSIPPLLMEQYLEVADAALDDVIKADQLKTHWTQLPATFIAPVEGSYTLTLKASPEKPPAKDPCRVTVRVNNDTVGELKVPGSSTLTFKLSAGSATLSTIIANPPRTMVLESVDLVGPPGLRPTPTQKRLFLAQPGKDLTPRDAARKILEPFARRAFRRPPLPQEIEPLLKAFDLADKKGAAFTESVRLMLKAVLVSPAFLCLTPDDAAPGGDIVPVGDFQLASKLSYLFWSTMPDDELSALADQGKLHDPAVLAVQVRRLVNDPRSRALFNSFGAAWLGIDHLIDLDADEKKVPKALRRAMSDEAAQFFDYVLKGNRSILEFVDADYAFLNDTVGKLYGQDIKGPKFTRVALTDKNRGGILTLPAVLAVTSLPGRTSPVKRGRWVLEQVLGQSPPPPPGNAPPLEQQAASVGNLRKRMEAHRQNPACAGCHQVMDQIGFGLENFDLTGRWRDKDDTGAAVDAKGILPGDITFSSPADLKRIIAARKDEFCRTLARRALSHALGRSLAGYDDVVVDDIAEAVARDGYKFQTLWIQIATSYPFLNRRRS